MRTFSYKILLLFALLLVPKGHVMAQGLPVYDNTNFITLGKQILESAKQTSEMLKTVEFLRQQKERLEKVSSIVKQLKSVKELTLNNERLFHMVRDDLREILDSPYVHPNEVLRVSRSFDVLIENALEDLEFVSQILSNDFLKMTDGERTKVLEEKRQRSQQMVTDIERKAQRYRDIISFREMQDRINNRETNF